jgi:hypothetical protein
MKSVHWLPLLLTLGVLLSTAGCGGGGGSSASNSPPVVTPAQNVQSIIVDSGPANTTNLVFTNVTICAPGNSANCQTIDHIMIDTGSAGLRVMSSVLAPSLSLPQQPDLNGFPIVECAQFVDGFAWGPVKLADVRISGERANSVPIQIIGDPGFSAVPNDCSSTGPAENTVQTFGANGILGVGVFLQDCGLACASSSIYGYYYSCPVSGCQPAIVGIAQQVQNPVAMFATDNNGVILVLPSVPPDGSATVAGSMIFGIGTQTNNLLGGATVLTVDPNTGFLTTVYNNRFYTDSFIDSGSSAIFFPDRNLPACTGSGGGFYCPSSTQNFSATIQGINGANAPVSFSVANADSLFNNNPSFFAFSNLGAPNSDAFSFAWGLPFFYGRTVYTAFEGQATIGPYVAF